MKNQKIKQLNRSLKYLTELLSTRDDSQNKITQEIELTRNILNKYMEEKTQTLMFMSSVNHYQEGERNTKYFMSLAKQKSQQKTMTRVETEDGTITEEPDKTLQEQKKFYEQLYTRDNNVQFKL